MPLFLSPVDDPQRQLYDKWEEFQIQMCDKIICHYETQKKSGTMPTVVEPYQLDEEDTKLANEVGPDVFGGWSFEAKMPDPASDPCVHMALMKVCCAADSFVLRAMYFCNACRKPFKLRLFAACACCPSGGWHCHERGQLPDHSRTSNGCTSQLPGVSQRLVSLICASTGFVYMIAK